MTPPTLFDLEPDQASHHDQAEAPAAEFVPFLPEAFLDACSCRHCGICTTENGITRLGHGPNSTYCARNLALYGDPRTTPCTCDPRHLDAGGYDRGCPSHDEGEAE